MQKILRKRILRDLKENLARYLALALLIVLGMYIVVSLVAAADTVIVRSAGAAKEQAAEDGQFRLFAPLDSVQLQKLEEKGVTVEAHFYLDYEIADGSVLRVFANREKIDRVQADFGELPGEEKDIFLEKRYCEEHDISVRDRITIGNRSFTVCGIGTTPDYEAPYRNLSDSAVDSKQFGTGFVSLADYEELKETVKSLQSEEHVYAYLLNDRLTDKELKEILQDFCLSAEDVGDTYFQEYWDRTGGKLAEFKEGMDGLTDASADLADGMSALEKQGKTLSETAAMLEAVPAFGGLQAGITGYTEGVADAAEGSRKLADGISGFSRETKKWLDDNFDTGLSKLTQFLAAHDNIRIGAAADDVMINKMAGLFAGVLLIILFAYVISVFVVHTIEKESQVIGTLYALGVKRRELLTHYLFLPVIITFVSGIIGTVVGYSSFGVRTQMKDVYNYFSVPDFSVLHEPYLLVYGILMPPAAAALTNLFVIYRKLKKPALSLIRREQKMSKSRQIKLAKTGFVRTFQIRQLLREMRTAFTIFFGMLFALLVCMISLNCYVLCEHVREDTVKDTKYEYMYTYKYPGETVPEDGEEAYGVTLKKEVLGYNLDVTLLGIHDGNPYFEAPVSGGQGDVLISEAVASKFGLNTGDDLVLKDGENDRSYAFTVKGTVPYSAGMFVFMDIDSLRKLMDKNEDYYNIVFADHALDIDSGRLYAASSKEEVQKSADVFVELMWPMIIMLSAVSALIFLVVMYLMLKVMVDRSASSISMLKVFGYRKKEIRKLYLNGNLAVVAVSALVSIPVSKAVMDALYPYLVSNVAANLNLTFSWWMYAGLFTAIIVLYFLSMPILMRRINKILPAEVLKNRE